VGNTNAVFARIVARASRVLKNKMNPHSSPASWQGCLDDPNWFRPQMDIFTSEAQPWDQMDPAIPKYEKYPPMA